MQIRNINFENTTGFLFNINWENNLLFSTVNPTVTKQIQPPEVFFKKKWSEKFQKIHRKTPVPESLFLIKLQGEACSFIKKETQAQVFSCEFCKISKNTLFTEHLRATTSD